MLNPNFKDMLSAFCDHNVEFMVVGAYAVGSHGLMRATGGIDLWVRPLPDNAARVIQALKAFGAPVGYLTVEDLATPGRVYQIGVQPERIDVLTQISGVSFDEADKNKIEVNAGGLSIPVIGRAELLKNKLASGRSKDLLDAEWLSREQT